MKELNEKELNELIRQKKNEYFRNYYKNHKDKVLAAHKRYWEKKIRQEQGEE